MENMDEIITRVLDSAEIAGTYAFELGVRHAITQGILSIITCVVVLALGASLVTIYYKIIRGKLGEIDSEFLDYFVVVASVMLLIVALCVCPMVLYEGIDKIINPEWWAVHDLIRIAK